MCFNQTGNISTLGGSSQKILDKIAYRGSRVSSTERDIDTWLTKVWRAINRLSVIWKSDLTDKMKCSFFQAAIMSILIYGWVIWTLTKRMEKNLMVTTQECCAAILNRSWRQHPTKQKLYGHLTPITKIIQIRGTRHAGHCSRSSDELISDVLQWTPSHVREKAGRPARTYIQQLSKDTGRSPEDLSEVMNDRERWRERVRDVRTDGTTSWDDDDDHLGKLEQIWWRIILFLKGIRHYNSFISWINSVVINTEKRKIK